jgi:LDH2 family malate/lactate/ureidoglycolate dehydrogenase
MMNVLAGILPGGHHTAAVDVGRRGQFFLVIAPDLLGDREAFLDGVGSMVRQIKGSELLPGVGEVYLPGELEQRQYQQRVELGIIVYPRSVVQDLVGLGTSIGIAFTPQ